MSDATVEEEAGEKKKSRLPLIIGLVLLPVGAAGGFFMVKADPLGLFGGGDKQETAAEESTRYADPIPLGTVGFVAVPPVVIPIGATSDRRSLRFQASLEVPSAEVNAVTAIVPRVQDVLNSYLRALDPADFEAPGALDRLRGQLLRRIKLVAGEENVRDLLVLEFIVN
jgi:flagellar FliL protein